MNKRILKDTLYLVLITLFAVLLLSAVHELTKEKIDKAIVKEREDSYREVCGKAASFEEITEIPDVDGLPGGVTLNSACYALDENGEKIGCVLSLTDKNGYGGNVTLSLGVTKDGLISGLKVTAMNESPGFGAKCKDEAFSKQFYGMKAKEIDQTELDHLSGATKTRKAVTGAVNAGLKYSYKLLDMEREDANDEKAD